jgi:hypothetical protein
MTSFMRCLPVCGWYAVLNLWLMLSRCTLPQTEVKRVASRDDSGWEAAGGKMSRTRMSH